jgi:hypothetical protein
MNAANKSVTRDCIAVDPIIAILLLLKLEAIRFSKNKEKAWSWNEVLTPHGKKLSDKVRTTLSQLMLSSIYMCVPSPGRPQTIPPLVGFPPHMMKMMDPSLADAPMEFRTPMAFHAITCVMMSSHIELMGSMRLMQCQHGGILPIGASNILVIVLFLPTLTFKVFAILLESIPTIPRISMSFAHFIQDPRKVEDQGKRNGSRGPLNL